jgi:hypothetical protein
MSTPPTPLPLAKAARRLRAMPPHEARNGVEPRPFPGKPGRPRTRPRPEPSGPSPSAKPADTVSPQPVTTRLPEPDAPGTRPETGLLPRLLGVREAAHYLGISEWSLREWVASGVVPQVRVPLPSTTKRRGDTCRRVLIDRYDLDSLISGWKANGKGA